MEALVTLDSSTDTPAASHIREALLESLPAEEIAEAEIRGCMSISHVFEPVRDSSNEVIDFRLAFHSGPGRQTVSPFVGTHIVEIGPSVAPREIFWTLKRVLETGDALRSETRHAGSGQELCFYQTAMKVGDTVVTTTSVAPASNVLPA